MKVSDNSKFIISLTNTYKVHDCICNLQSGIPFDGSTCIVTPWMGCQFIRGTILPPFLTQQF